MQIVQRDQAQPEDFFGFDEMPDVGAGKTLARRARAPFF
jgi:hypothetical protein